MRAVTPHERRRWMQQEGNLGLLNRNRPPRKRIGSHQRVVLASWASHAHRQPPPQLAVTAIPPLVHLLPLFAVRAQARTNAPASAPIPTEGSVSMYCYYYYIYKFASSGAFSCVPVSFFSASLVRLVMDALAVVDLASYYSSCNILATRILYV